MRSDLSGYYGVCLSVCLYGWMDGCRSVNFHGDTTPPHPMRRNTMQACSPCFGAKGGRRYHAPANRRPLIRYICGGAKVKSDIARNRCIVLQVMCFTLSSDKDQRKFSLSPQYNWTLVEIHHFSDTRIVFIISIPINNKKVLLWETARGVPTAA